MRSVVGIAVDGQCVGIAVDGQQCVGIGSVVGIAVDA